MELKITINQAGQVLLNGPINDPILCFGLLEMAKVQLTDYHRQRAQVAAGGVEIATGPQAQQLLKPVNANGRN